MLSLDAQAIGADRFRRLSDPRGAITQASWAFMRKQGAVYLQYAIEEAPVGQDWSQSRGGFNLPGHPGLLKQSHVLRVLNPFNAEVVNTQHYATFVATGTRPHMPPASSGLPWPVRRHIAEHGTKPNPWFDRAFERGEAHIQANLEQMGAEIVQAMLP